MADTQTIGADLRQLQAYPNALQFVSGLSSIDRDKLAALAVQLKTLMDSEHVTNIDASEVASGVFDDLHGIVDNLSASPIAKTSVIERNEAWRINHLIDSVVARGTLENVTSLLGDISGFEGRDVSRLDLLLSGSISALEYELEVMRVEAGVCHG